MSAPETSKVTEGTLIYHTQPRHYRVLFSNYGYRSERCVVEFITLHATKNNSSSFDHRTPIHRAVSKLFRHKQPAALRINERREREFFYAVIVDP
jgi:hypothetical protein